MLLTLRPVSEICVCASQVLLKVPVFLMAVSYSLAEVSCASNLNLKIT